MDAYFPRRNLSVHLIRTACHTPVRHNWKAFDVDMCSYGTHRDGTFPATPEQSCMYVSAYMDVVVGFGEGGRCATFSGVWMNQPAFLTSLPNASGVSKL
jgi:hypothetical protein